MEFQILINTLAAVCLVVMIAARPKAIWDFLFQTYLATVSWNG